MFDGAGAVLALLQDAGRVEGEPQSAQAEAPDGAVQSAQGASATSTTGAGAGGKPSAAEVGRTLREQRTRSPHEAAGSSVQESGGQPGVGLETRLPAMQTSMFALLQGQKSAFFEERQANATEVIRDEVAEVKQAVGIVQREVGRCKKSSPTRLRASPGMRGTWTS